MKLRHEVRQSLARLEKDPHPLEVRQLLASAEKDALPVEVRQLFVNVGRAGTRGTHLPPPGAPLRDPRNRDVRLLLGPYRRLLFRSPLAVGQSPRADRLPHRPLGRRAQARQPKGSLPSIENASPETVPIASTVCLAATHGVMTLANSDTTPGSRSFSWMRPCKTTTNGKVAVLTPGFWVCRPTSSITPGTAPVTRLPFGVRAPGSLAAVASTVKGHPSLHGARDGSIWKQPPPVEALCRGCSST